MTVWNDKRSRLYKESFHTINKKSKVACVAREGKKENNAGTREKIVVQNIMKNVEKMKY